MHFRITATSVELVEPRDTTEFHVTCPRRMGQERLAELVQEAGLGALARDGEHVMVPVRTVRRMAAGRVTAEWEGELDTMVRYAASKGWTDEGRSRIRAHVERQ